MAGATRSFGMVVDVQALRRSPIQLPRAASATPFICPDGSEILLSEADPLIALALQSDREREAVGGMDGDRDLEDLTGRIKIATHDLERWSSGLGLQLRGQPLGNQ